MIINSLRTKVMILVGGGLLLAALGIASLAHNGMRDVIDRSQPVVYQDKVDHILGTLTQYHNELGKTLQVEAYRDQFQEEALRIIRLNHLADADENAYPFILDAKSRVLLHPELVHGDGSLANLDYIQTLLKNPAGSFKYHYLGEDKWLTYAQFEPWGWVIVYSLKQSFMYADVNRFHDIVLPGIFIVLLLTTAVLFYGLRHFLRPILSLAEAADTIASGDLEQPIAVIGRDEISVLAGNFESMRTAVRQTISSLNEQRSKLEKEVTERQRAETQAQAAEERLRVILRSAADPLLVTDFDHRILMLNPAAQALFPEADISQPLREICDDTSLEEIIEPIVRGEKDHVKKEWSPYQTKTTPHIYNTNAAVIFEPGNKRVGVVTLLHDITKARELDRLKSEFLSTAAHELRTPLTVIQGFSELLIDNPDTPQSDRQEYLGIVLQRCGTLETLIEDLLDVSRIETGQGLKLTIEDFDLSRLAAESVAHYQRGSTGHQFTFHGQGSALNVSADNGKIQRALENLLSNATKFSPPDSGIEVTCEATNGFALVQVKDQGDGISSEKKDRIFEKFYRIDGSDTAPQGLGLGLHIVKNIITAHGGQISLESQPGQGATFSFRLPLRQNS